MAEPKIYRLIGKRPECVPQGMWIKQAIPADWPIFNAPRPLYGDYTWQGDFVHGIFYAAVKPNDLYTKIWVENNVSLDGWQLEWHSAEEVMTWAKEKAIEYEVDLEDWDWESIAQSWHQNKNS